MAFTYLKVKFAKCLCLLPVVLILVLRTWSCLHHWLQLRRDSPATAIRRTEVARRSIRSRVAVVATALLLNRIVRYHVIKTIRGEAKK